MVDHSTENCGRGVPGHAGQEGAPRDAPAADANLSRARIGELLAEAVMEPGDELAPGKAGARLAGMQFDGCTQGGDVIGRGGEQPGPAVAEQVFDEGGDSPASHVQPVTTTVPCMKGWIEQM